MQSSKKFSRSICSAALLTGLSATVAAQPTLDPVSKIPEQIIAQKTQNPENRSASASKAARGNFIPKEKISADSAVAFPVDI
jgi:hypothetical protein